MAKQRPGQQKKGKKAQDAQKMREKKNKKKTNDLVIKFDAADREFVFVFVLFCLVWFGLVWFGFLVV